MYKKFWLANLKVRPLVRPRCKWEDIRMDLKRNTVGRCGPDASGSGQGPVADCCEHGNDKSSDY
jgi:hypothetical protein